MLEYRRDKFIQTSKALGFLILMLSFVLAGSDTLRIMQVESGKSPLHGIDLAFIVIIMVYMYAVYTFIFDKYFSKTDFFVPKLHAQILNFILILICTSIGFIILAYFFNVEINYFRFFTVFFCISLLLNIILRRLMVYAFSMLFQNKRNLRNIVIVGTNQRAVEFTNYINDNAFLGARVVGFIDDCNFSGKDINILGDLNSLDKVIRNNVIHGIVVNLPIRSFYDTIRSIISIAQEQGISVNYLTNIFEPDSPYMRSYQLGSIPAVVIYNAPLEDWQVSIKRFIDVVVALAVLVLTAPIILVAAIVIKLTDGGPIFFKQERVGYFKNTFKLIKLRTMSIDAATEHSKLEALNEMDGPVFKIANDPRVLPVGRFLRRYGIDELPQLVNVLKGDMSVVGPRPLAIRDYEGFSEDWLRRRFSVRPGLTCYWQTTKNRNKLGFNEWMNLDMDYIDNWSLWEDFKIMLRTVPAVIRGTGV